MIKTASAAFLLLWPIQSVAHETLCDGSDLSADTNCIQIEIDALEAAGGGEITYPSGIYLVDRVQLRSNVSLRCANPHTAVFKRFSNSSQMFINSTGGSNGAHYPVQNITIENCGFDNNGADFNFDSLINISDETGGTINDHIVTRNNRLFDSANPGGTPGYDHQRLWIILIGCDHCSALDNYLSDGGRIKAGRPGSYIHIRGNVIDHANDNAITVVARGDQKTSRMIISENIIDSPTNICIFFGGDGENNAQDPDQVVSDISIIDNICTGTFTGSCIRGVFPANSDRILISGNTCHGEGVSAPQRSGIKLKSERCDLRPVRQLTITDNIIAGPEEDPFDAAGVFLSGCYDMVIIANNQMRLVGGDAVRFAPTDDMTSIVFASNVLDGGRLRIDSDHAFQGSITGNTISWDAGACLQLGGAGPFDLEMHGNTLRCVEDWRGP